LLAGVLANASNREPAGGWNEGVATGSAVCFAGLICEDSDPTKVAKTEFRLDGRSAAVEGLVEGSDSLVPTVSDNESVEDEGSMVVG